MRRPALERLREVARPARDRWRAGAPARRRIRRRVGRLLSAVAALPGRPWRLRALRALETELANRPAPARPVATFTVVTTGIPLDAVKACNESTSDLVCLLDPACDPIDPTWLERLVHEVHDDIAAAVPVLVSPVARWPKARRSDGRVRAAGYDIAVTSDGTPTIHPRGTGARPALGDPASCVATSRGGCIVLSRRWLELIGGMREVASIDGVVLDHCERIAAHGGHVVVVPDAIVLDTSDTGADDADPAWRETVEAHGPAIVRRVRRPEHLRIAISTAAPSRKVASRWGDWHFAEGLGRAFSRLGHEVLVQTAEEHDTLAGRACDLHVVLRGLVPVRRTRGQRHVLWVISHPDTLDPAECDAADAVFVASERYAASLRPRTRSPVHVLLQATDPRRFHRSAPPAGHHHDVVVVAKTRDVLRPIVRDALSVGIRPAIFGTGWERFVDPALIVERYVPNAQLAAVYSSAAIVLNDHWEDMREHGFVSNRIFDALACGTPVISDHLPEIEGLFASTVATYRTPDELGLLVGERLADRDKAREVAERGREIVLGHHTFDHRANQLLEHIGIETVHGARGGTR